MEASVRRLSDAYVERSAELDPIFATFAGIRGHDRSLTDLSPDGLAARAEHARRTLRDLGQVEAADDAERVSASFMAERLAADLALHDADEHLRPLNNLVGPVQVVRQVFDLMPTDDDDDWATVAARMRAVPDALGGLGRTLEAGRSRGLFSAARQAEACAEQCEAWSGSTGTTPFFVALIQRYDGDRLRGELERSAAEATSAYAELGRYLRDEYLPEAPERDAVGRDRYRLLLQRHAGIDLDLEETYAWGWEELHEVEAAMRRTADQIVPGATVDEAIEHLQHDPELVIEGEDRLRGWLQDLMDRTIAELDGTHFDIPDRIKRVEAMIAPPGGAAAMYYTAPSEDFSRPGRTWYPTQGRTRFPLWGEVSIAYHEGVPGHHLQIAQVLHLGAAIPRFSRLTFVSGHAEGWALYAERLMEELGYLSLPAYRFGLLRSQALRSARVVADIGMHLELEIPAGEFAGGRRWTAELGREFLRTRARYPADFMDSELVRYLGLPAQAITYKVGEQVWLRVRKELRRRQGPDFDLKDFHCRALDLGNVGLDQLEAELLATATDR